MGIDKLAVFYRILYLPVLFVSKFMTLFQSSHFPKVL